MIFLMNYELEFSIVQNTNSGLKFKVCESFLETAIEISQSSQSSLKHLSPLDATKINHIILGVFFQQIHLGAAKAKIKNNHCNFFSEEINQPSF